MRQLLWFVIGAALGAGVTALVKADREPGAPERPDGPAQAEVPAAQEPDALPETDPEPAVVEPPSPWARRTIKPVNRDQVIGRWDDPENMVRLRLKADGTYGYSGIDGEWAEGLPVPAPGTVRTRRGVRIRLPLPPVPELIRPGYAKPHVGTWTFVDDVLVLEPDNVSTSTHLVFEWDRDDRTLYVRFLGVKPGHVPGVTVERLAEIR